MRRVAMHLLGVAADVAMAVFDASGRAMRWLDRLHDRLDMPSPPPLPGNSNDVRAPLVWHGVNHDPAAVEFKRFAAKRCTTRKAGQA